MYSITIKNVIILGRYAGGCWAERTRSERVAIIRRLRTGDVANMLKRRNVFVASLLQVNYVEIISNRMDFDEERSGCTAAANSSHMRATYDVRP